MSHPHQPGAHQPGMGRAQPPASPSMNQSFMPPAQPPRMPPPPPGEVAVAREHVSDFGDRKEFKPGSAAAQLAQAVSRTATDATQGTPAPQAQPAKPDPNKPYVFTFSYPIDNGGSKPITEVTFKRPKWSDFQKAMRHRLVLSGEMTDNDALISAVTGLNLELIPEIDGFDGARLLVEVQNFFLTDPMVKLSGT